MVGRHPNQWLSGVTSEPIGVIFRSVFTHDFGSFKADGAVIFFKIDYYDKALAAHSPDPADPSVTERVITIMLAEEY
jgi:hypothetical protein